MLFVINHHFKIVSISGYILGLQAGEHCFVRDCPSVVPASVCPSVRPTLTLKTVRFTSIPGQVCLLYLTLQIYLIIHY